MGTRGRRWAAEGQGRRGAADVAQQLPEEVVGEASSSGDVDGRARRDREPHQRGAGSGPGRPQ